MKLEEPEWEIDISYLIEQKGFDPEMARTFTVLRWMALGDLRPLAYEIIAGRPLDEGVLNLLSRMILDQLHPSEPFRIITQKRKPGRPKDPSKFARDYISTLGYAGLDGTSAEKFEHLADIIRRSPKSVRAAVTQERRRKAK
jgi:hypothetical protein